MKLSNDELSQVITYLMLTFLNEVCLCHGGCPHLYCSTCACAETQAAHSSYLKEEEQGNELRQAQIVIHSRFSLSVKLSEEGLTQ